MKFEKKLKAESFLLQLRLFMEKERINDPSHYGRPFRFFRSNHHPVQEDETNIICFVSCFFDLSS